MLHLKLSGSFSVGCFSWDGFHRQYRKMLNYAKSDSNIVEDGEQLHFYMGTHTNAHYDVI